MAEINLKTGQENNMPSTKKEGTVYFTVDTINNIGKIFFDHSSSTRVNIVPDRVDCGSWNVIDLGYKNPNCCFVAGTKILCDLEGTTKCIEDIIAGDKIISYNIFSQEFYTAMVQTLIVNTNTTHIAFILLDNGVTLEMNAYHPIYTLNGFHSLTNYNNYDTLVVGDMVKCIDGYHEIIDIIETHSQQPIITYNLAIKDINEQEDNDTNDTFIANGCVVHNTPCMT